MERRKDTIGVSMIIVGEPGGDVVEVEVDVRGNCVSSNMAVASAVISPFWERRNV